jgi:hypothetical protein
MYDVVSRDGRPATTCCTTTVDRSQGSLVSDTVPYRDTSPYRQLVSPSMKRPGVMYDLVRDMSLGLEDAAIGTTLAIQSILSSRNDLPVPRARCQLVHPRYRDFCHL